MEDEKNSSSMKMFAGIIIGAAIGSVLALLFAPRSGDETREKIKDMTDKVEDDVREGFEKVSKLAKSFVDSAKGKIAEQKEKMEV
jgi:gas vesicle protein